MEREQFSQSYMGNFQNSPMKDDQLRQQSQSKALSGGEEVYLNENSCSKKDKNHLQSEEISSLYTRKTNMQRFMDLIGEWAHLPVRNDIIEHCEKVSILIPANLSRESVTKLVKNRVDKMIKNKRIKKNWSQEDIKILVWVISKYCQYHGIADIREGMTEADWANIAELIPGVTGRSCMFKWLSLKKNNLAENNWMEEESLLLDQLVRKHGENSWCRVAEELFLRNPLPNKIYRCPKQCRQHWNCYLNPQLKKGPWEKEEDYLLLRAVLELNGVKKWAEIVKMFNGRTENALKNRFNLIVQKQMKELKYKKKVTETEIVESYVRKYETQFEIQKQKLSFLLEKKQHYIESQSRKKPKQPLALRKKKQPKVQSEQDQYVPEQNCWKMARRMTRAHAQSQKSLEVGQSPKLKPSQEIELKQSVDLQHSMIPKEANDQIFQQDQDYLAGAIKWEKEFRTEAIPISIGKGLMVAEEHTHEQNISIEPNCIAFVPFTDEIMKRLANHTLIPCKLNEANQIVQLRIAE